MTAHREHTGLSARGAVRPMRIAMLGTRGIPATYSGFETCVEQLSIRLVERGHSVTVYCRRHHVKWPEPTYMGVRLVTLPTIATKHLDTIVHTFLSMLHVALRRYDVVYVCGVGNAPLALISRLFGKPTVVNVDGPDWQRDKWGRAAKRYLRFAERSATRLPTCIIADSRAVERYYLREYGAILGLHPLRLPDTASSPRSYIGAVWAVPARLYPLGWSIGAGE